MKALLLALALAAPLAAQAQTPPPPTLRAWLSAGTGCEGGSKLTYTVGVPFAVSLCAQNEAPACGFTAQLEADLPEESGLFQILRRTLHPAFDDPTAPWNFATPLPVVHDPANSPYFYDLGGTGMAGDASIFDNRPLMTVTLVATPAAAAQRRVIGLSEWSGIGIAVPDPQYPAQPCAGPADMAFGLTPIYLDASTLPTPWLKPAKGLALKSHGAAE